MLLRVLISALLCCAFTNEVSAACAGDCGNDGRVTINELLVMVNVALGSAPSTDCRFGDTNGDNAIAIDEIIAAVHNALAGCVPSALSHRVCVLHDFGETATDPTYTDPTYPDTTGSLLQDLDGSLYGMTTGGGDRNLNLGAVYKITPQGQFTVLHSFNGLDGGNRQDRQGGIVLDDKGTIFGTTYAGGRWGRGTIFRLQPTGACEVIHDFRGTDARCLTEAETDPQTGQPVFSARQTLNAAPGYPRSPPVWGADGNLYGVTYQSFAQDFGALYRISPEAPGRPCDQNPLPCPSPWPTMEALETLCVFVPPSRLREEELKRHACNTTGTGAMSLTASSDRTILYGTTLNAMDGVGSVFASTLSGDVTPLHIFTRDDGANPYNVTQASDGILYGTTPVGTATGTGVVYRLDPNTRNFEILSTFEPITAQGIVPYAGLADGCSPAVRKLPGACGSDFDLFGAARYGGRNGRGTLYSVHADGSDLEVLHHFDLYETGRSPIETPLFSARGRCLYGTTNQGGKYDKGVVYRLNQNPSADRPRQGMRAVGSDAVVEVLTEIPSSEDPSIHDGISITVNCDSTRDCASSPHVVQFFRREIIDEDGRSLIPAVTSRNPRCDVPEPVGAVEACAAPHPDPKDCRETTTKGDLHWHTDARPPNPYYDEQPCIGRWSESHTLTIFDAPTFFFPKFYYEGTTTRIERPKAKTWKFFAKDFVFCNGEVIREIDWKVVMKRGGSPSPPRVVSIAIPADTHMLPDEFRQVMAAEGFFAVP
jgi:uncharacterized repeat protein (TIGR03803 family)